MTEEEAVDEIALRLAYEFIFDIIPKECFEKSTWMDSTLRDEGHHKRMCILIKRCNNSFIKYPWIQACMC